MKKLLVICGPTAIGKTRLALYLAKVFNGELISADSRQVYQGMDIGTGKEWGQGVKIWGYDLIEPTRKFSAAQYAKYAKGVIKRIWQKNKLPILVGGTGFYIEAVTAGFETLDVGRNKKLRATLKNISAHELFTILANLDPRKARSLNISDRQNPRRLIRAIEVAQVRKVPKEKEPFKADVLWIGLTAPKEFLREKITKRVEERIKRGFAKEVESLKRRGFWEGAPKVTLGYREWPDINKWKIEEFKYAKRQMTWFRHNKEIKWFAITQKSLAKEVEKMVKKWYSSDSYHAKKN